MHKLYIKGQLFFFLSDCRWNELIEKFDAIWKVASN